MGAGGRDKNRGCYFCGDLNHWANDCPYNNGIRVSEGRCFGCGSKTHTIQNCPDKDKFTKLRI